MTTQWQQTDTTIFAALGCTPGGANGVIASVGGTPGTGTTSIQGSSSGVDEYLLAFVIQPSSATSAPSGNYVMRLNITTANMNLTWTKIDLIEINGSCGTVQTLGTTSSLGISLGTTGVKSATITLGSPVSITSGNPLAFRLYFSNGAMSVQSAADTNNQLIDTPDFAAGVAPSARDWYEQARAIPKRSPDPGRAVAILDLPVQFIVPASGTDAYGLFESVPPPSIGRGRARSFIELTPPTQAVAPTATDVYDLAAQRFTAWPRDGRARQAFADMPYVGIGAADFYDPATLRFKPERQHPGRALANNVFMPYVGISSTDWFEPVRALQPRIGRGTVAELASPQPYVGISTSDFYEPGTIRFRAWTLTGRIAAALTLTAPPADYAEHARSKPQFAPQIGNVVASFAPFQPSATVAPNAALDWYALAALYQPRPAQRGAVSFTYVALPVFVAPSSADWYTQAALRARPAAPQLGRVASIEVNLPYVGINARDWYEPGTIRARLTPLRGRVAATDRITPLPPADFAEFAAVRSVTAPRSGRVAATDRITPLLPADFAEFAALRPFAARLGRVASAYSDQAPIAYPNFYATVRFRAPDARQSLKSFYSDQAAQQAAVVQDFSYLYGVATRAPAGPVSGVARAFLALRVAFSAIGSTRRGWEPGARTGFDPSGDRNSAPGARDGYDPSGPADYAPSGKRDWEA